MDTQTASRQEMIAAWYKRWRKPMRQWFANWSGIRTADRDDLVQEVFIRLLRYYDSDTALVNSQGYIFKVGANVAREFLTKVVNRDPHSACWLDDLLVSEDALPESIISSSLDSKLVWRCLDQMPTRIGIMLVQHAYDGMTYKQIAADLRLNYRIVLRDLTLGYKILRKMLGTYDLSRTIVSYSEAKGMVNREERQKIKAWKSNRQAKNTGRQNCDAGSCDKGFEEAPQETGGQAAGQLRQGGYKRRQRQNWQSFLEEGAAP